MSSESALLEKVSRVRLSVGGKNEESRPVSTAAIVGGGAVGTAGLGGHMLAKKLKSVAEPYNAVMPEGLAAARDFAGVNMQGDTGKALTDYVMKGHRAAATPAIKLPNGRQLTGAQAALGMRDNEVWRFLASKGLVEKIDGSTASHYNEFAKSPLAGYAQMLHESGGNNMQPHLNELLTARSEAAAESVRNGKVHPTLLRQKLLTMMKEKALKDNPGADVAPLKKFVYSLEDELRGINPHLQQESLDHVARNLGNTHDSVPKITASLNQRLTEAAAGHMPVPSDLRAVARMHRAASRLGVPYKNFNLDLPTQLAPELQEKVLRQLTGSGTDLLSKVHNDQMARWWANAPKDYGKMMVGPAELVQRSSNKVLGALEHGSRLGRNVALGGGALLGAGALYKALNHKKKPAFEFNAG